MKVITNDTAKSLTQIKKSLKRGKAGSLNNNQAFIDFLYIQKQMTEEIDAVWAIIKDGMEESGISKINGDWGYITMAERVNYSGTAEPKLMKSVLDTSKVKAYMALNDKLPKGVLVSTTRFLQKKITLV